MTETKQNFVHLFPLIQSDSALAIAAVANDQDFQDGAMKILLFVAVAVAAGPIASYVVQYQYRPRPFPTTHLVHSDHSLLPDLPQHILCFRR